MANVPPANANAAAAHMNWSSSDIRELIDQRMKEYAMYLAIAAGAQKLMTEHGYAPQRQNSTLILVVSIALLALVSLMIVMCAAVMYSHAR